MSNYVLDKAYRILNEGGIEAGIAVAPGEGEGTCRVATPADPRILGVTTYSQPREGAFVAVRRLGIAGAVATGEIARGDLVRVANESGHLGRCPLPRYSSGSVGAGNALVFHWLDRELFGAGLVLEFHDPETEAPFSWTILNGALRLSLAHDEIEVVQTAASLIADIEGDATLSQLLSVAGEPGSSGAGTVATGVLHAENLADIRFPVAIAENGASGPGDILDVFLRP